MPDIEDVIDLTNAEFFYKAKEKEIQKEFKNNFLKKYFPVFVISAILLVIVLVALAYYYGILEGFDVQIFQ